MSLSKAYINRLGNDKGGRIPALTVGNLGVVNPPHANILYRLNRSTAVIGCLVSFDTFMTCYP